MSRFSSLGTALTLIAAAAAYAVAAEVTVYNPTDYAVTAVETKKPEAKEWNDDVLGKTALGVGKAEKVQIQDCKVDLRITFDDGRKVEQKNVDVCTNGLRIQDTGSSQN